MFLVCSIFLLFLHWFISNFSRLIQISVLTSISFSSDVIIQAIKSLGLRAVKVEPPITNEIILVENGSVGAQKWVFGESTLSVSGANVENLALGLRVGIISCKIKLHKQGTGDQTWFVTCVIFGKIWKLSVVFPDVNWSVRFKEPLNFLSSKGTHLSKPFMVRVWGGWWLH